MFWGASLSQGLVLVFSPVLSRLYDPTEFGVFNVFLSVTGIVASVSALTYNGALMLPKQDTRAARVLVLCLGLVGATTCLLAVPLALLPDGVLTSVFSATIVALKWWFPPALALAGATLALEAWSARSKHFGTISVSRICRSTFGIATQLFGAALKWGAWGLVLGNIVGSIAALAVLSHRLIRFDREKLKDAFDLRNLNAVAVEFSDFPRYNAPQTFLNAASQNMPVLLLAYFFGAGTAGLYGMAHRVVQLPSMLILASVRQVLFQKCSEVHQQHRDTFATFKKSTLALLGIVLIPTLAIMVTGPTLFAVVLGEKWAVAGSYARWLMLWLGSGFVNPPAIIFAQIYRQQRALLVQQLILFCARAACLILGGLYNSPMIAIGLYGVTGMACNVWVILWMWLFLSRLSFDANACPPTDKPQQETTCIHS